MNASNDTYILSGDQRVTQPLGVRLSGRLRQFRLGWSQRRASARQMQELHLSTDRELWDMGITRGDLNEIAKGTYRRD